MIHPVQVVSPQNSTTTTTTTTSTSAALYCLLAFHCLPVFSFGPTFALLKQPVKKTHSCHLPPIHAFPSIHPSSLFQTLHCAVTHTFTGSQVSRPSRHCYLWCWADSQQASPWYDNISRAFTLSDIWRVWAGAATGYRTFGSSTHCARWWM